MDRGITDELSVLETHTSPPPPSIRTCTSGGGRRDTSTHPSEGVHMYDDLPGQWPCSVRLHLVSETMSAPSSVVRALAVWPGTV